MVKKNLALTTLSALALSACAAGPDFVVPSLPPAATGPYLSAEAQAVSPTPLPTEWWRLYNDPVLDGLVEDTLRANTDIRQAVARIARARAGLRGARADRLPQTDIAGGANYARLPESSVPAGARREHWAFDAGVEIGYEVDFFGRVSGGIEAARLDLAATTADADAIRVIAVADTTRAYADAASAAARLQVARDIVALLDRSLALTRKRHDAGMENGLAVARIETLREQRASQIPAIEAERRAALFALATLTGKAPAELPSIAGERSVALEISVPLPVGEGRDLLARRPDVQAAEQRLAANTARIGVATADLYPRITFGGSLGASGPNIGDLFDGGALRFLLGPLINWAFPNQEPARARIAAAEAATQESLAAFDNTVLRALQDTETALIYYARALDRRQALQAAKAAASRAAAITRARQREGIVNSLELLDSERTLAEARAELADQDGEISRRQIDLFRVLGGGWDRQGSSL